MELNDRQRAEPGQCGSCQHFRARVPGDGFGLCEFKLPPWLMNYFKQSSYMWEVDPRTVSDTASCTFYKAKNIGGDPVQFIQQRYWNAGEPSR